MSHYLRIFQGDNFTLEIYVSLIENEKFAMIFTLEIYVSLFDYMII